MKIRRKESTLKKAFNDSNYQNFMDYTNNQLLLDEDDEETKNDNQILNEKNQKNDFIKNRLSERTIFADIYKEYVITDNILGKGATGIVREGRDKEGKKVAIKSVWKSDIEKNECFKKEIDISLDVQHDSIVKCIDVYEDNTSLHFVLEEINGGDLFDHIIHSDGRKLKEPEAMNILCQILEGLHYLHDEKGIVHRDIKPENFLLYNDGIKVRIKLIDFGFATYCKNEETMNDLLGTPQYAAPEIFEQKPYTSKVDMWSLGVVLYNMVKGTQPFSNRDIEKIKEQVLHKEINYNGFNNNDLKNLCMGLLERDPEKRYSAFQAFNELKIIQNRATTEGMGECVYPDGRIYKGLWKEGKQDGEGMFYIPDKKVWKKGIWDKGKRVQWISGINNNEDIKLVNDN